jgi:hypothetical protein
MGPVDPRIRTALLSIHPTSERPAWHGAPTAIGLLRGVGVDVATFRPYPKANSLREVALHVAFWENSVANRLTGGRERVDFEQRETGWAVRADAIDAVRWKAEVRAIKAAHAYLVRAVAEFDPRGLDAPLGERSTRPAIEIIHGVGEHTLYHAAQIKMLKALARRAEAK